MVSRFTGRKSYISVMYLNAKRNYFLIISLGIFVPVINCCEPFRFSTLHRTSECVGCFYTHGHS